METWKNAITGDVPSAIYWSTGDQCISICFYFSSTFGHYLRLQNLGNFRHFDYRCTLCLTHTTIEIIAYPVNFISCTLRNFFTIVLGTSNIRFFGDSRCVRIIWRITCRFFLSLTNNIVKRKCVIMIFPGNIRVLPRKFPNILGPWPNSRLYR